MARYGIFVYSSDPAPVSFGVGFAFQPGTTATSIRGDVVSAGPFHDGPLVMAGSFIVEAPDLDVALAIARANPATRDGGVEVRPLVE